MFSTAGGITEFEKVVLSQALLTPSQGDWKQFLTYTAGQSALLLVQQNGGFPLNFSCLEVFFISCL